MDNKYDDVWVGKMRNTEILIGTRFKYDEVWEFWIDFFLTITRLREKQKNPSQKLENDLTTIMNTFRCTEINYWTLWTHEGLISISDTAPNRLE